MSAENLERRRIIIAVGFVGNTGVGDKQTTFGGTELQVRQVPSDMSNQGRKFGTWALFGKSPDGR